jgi:hypothetical protein
MCSESWIIERGCSGGGILLSYASLTAWAKVPGGRKEEVGLKADRGAIYSLVNLTRKEQEEVEQGIVGSSPAGGDLDLRFTLAGCASIWLCRNSRTPSGKVKRRESSKLE